MNTLMDGLIGITAECAAWLFIWSWQALVLLACVWVGLTLARVKSPTLRHRIWLLGLVAVASFPLWFALNELLSHSRPIRHSLLQTVELPLPAIVEPALESVAPLIVSTASPVQTLDLIQIALSGVFLAWMIGVTRSLALAAGAATGLKLIRRRAVRMTLAELEIDESECAGSKRGGPRVGLSGEIGSPILVGVLHPMILLPMDIATWTSPRERRAMVRHESAHLARRDHFVNLFQTVLGAVFFFHPLVRYAGHRLSLDREMACDEQVVSSGIHAELYAESILKAAEREVAGRGANQLAFFSARRVLEKRIEAILNTDQGRVIRRGWRYLFPATALMAVITWLLIPGRVGGADLFQDLGGYMTSSTRFQYPVGSDEEILSALARKLGETLARDDRSMSRYLDPEDCREVEFLGRQMSKTIKAFRKRGSVITGMDVIPDPPAINQDDKAFLIFRAVIHFRNSRDGSETTISRQYYAAFKKVKGQWRATRDLNDLASLGEAGLTTLPTMVSGPPMFADQPTVQPAGLDQSHRDSEEVAAALREWADAILRRDRSALERFLTDDYDGWFPEDISENGYSYWDPVSKDRQLAAVEKHRPAAEKFEFANLRVYPAIGSELGAIALFTGAPLIQVDGLDSNKKYGYYVRLDKQPAQWKVSTLKVAPTFEFPPFPDVSGGSGKTEFEFVFDPDGKNSKKRK